MSTLPSAPPTRPAAVWSAPCWNRPRPDVHARVLYELGCATLLTSPSTTIEHLQSALAMPGLDGDTRVDAVVPAVPGAPAQRPAGGRRPHGRRGGRPARPRTRPDAAAGRAATCGRASTRTRSTPRAAPRSSPSSRPPARAGTTPSARCSSCAASTLMMRGESAEEVVEFCDRALVNGRLAPGLGWTDDQVGHRTAADAGELVRLHRPPRPGREPLHGGPAHLREGRLERRPPRPGPRLPRARAPAAGPPQGRGGVPARVPAPGRVGSAADCPCTGRRPAFSSTRCSPAATSTRPGTSPSSTASRRRTRPPSSCPTPAPYAAGCCSPSATRRTASTNWRPRRRRPSPAATTTRWWHRGAATSPAPWPRRTRAAPPNSRAPSAATPNASAPTRPSARPSARRRPGERPARRLPVRPGGRLPGGVPLRVRTRQGPRAPRNRRRLSHRHP